MTASTQRAALDTVEAAAVRRPDVEQPWAELGLKPDEYATHPRDPRPPPDQSPSWPCTRSCGASTAPTSRRKVHLRQFWGENTTDEMREKLLVGIGENAGVVDIGDGWAVTFKVECHNHPSYVEPYQGAATGVGGIVRDIMCDGRAPDRGHGPAAVRRPRPPRHPARAAGHRRRRRRLRQLPRPAQHRRRGRVRRLLPGQPAGQRPVRRRDAASRTSTWPRPPASATRSILFGAKTGGDGIGGVSVLASETFDEGGPTKRPAVQVGDPFAEKVLIECCLDLYAAHVVDGIQDLGGAGLSCATSELASNGDGGMQV